MAKTLFYIDYHDEIDSQRYDEKYISQVIDHTLSIMSDKLNKGVCFAYFEDTMDYWHQSKTLDIYITNAIEGRMLNLEARGKDYATNILSYPSELPPDVFEMMGEIPLGELIICHDVVVREANEQNKTFKFHLTHLIVHGILHLLGFDHEISDMDADEMEGFEIEILQGLGVSNPYA